MADVLAVALVAAGAVGCGVAVWYLTRPATAPTVDAVLIGGPFAGEAIKVPLAGGMPPTGYVRQYGAPGGVSARAVYTLSDRAWPRAYVHDPWQSTTGRAPAE